MSASSLRGRCHELASAAVAVDPSLRLVRGWYWCPIWNRDEEHWWTVRSDGTITDPTAAQFPSGGDGEYREFDGFYPCSNCGTPTREVDLCLGVTCTYECYGTMIGFPSSGGVR